MKTINRFVEIVSTRTTIIETHCEKNTPKCQCKCENRRKTHQRDNANVKTGEKHTKRTNNIYNITFYTWTNIVFLEYMYLCDILGKIGVITLEGIRLCLLKK